MTREEAMEYIAASQVLATLAVAYSNMALNKDFGSITRERYSKKSEQASEKAVRCLQKAETYSVEALL